MAACQLSVKVQKQYNYPPKQNELRISKSQAVLEKSCDVVGATFKKKKAATAQHKLQTFFPP